jgi:CxxC motif-containing protein (DUF1111 family)
MLTLAGVCALAAPLASSAPENTAPSAGDFTLYRFDQDAFAEPGPTLSYQQRELFMAGRVQFNQKWVLAPSLAGDWGLGPTFITDKCSNCHIRAGRGAPPKDDEEPVGLLLRLSIAGEDEHGGPKPHPKYGDQFQNQGLQGKDEYNHGKGDRVPPEGNLFIDWSEQEVAFADGEKVQLRSPKVRLEKLAFGPIGDDTMKSLRYTQPLYGLGLLEAVSEETVLEVAKQQAQRGYKGRPNYVFDHITKTTKLGRFGWKANVPSVRLQIAFAFLGDIGVTSSLFIDENCPEIQKACREFTPNNRPELIDTNWDQLEFWELTLAVPAQRNVNDEDFKRGAALFEQAECSVCHLPEMKTASEFKKVPQLANQTFRAYTDLLVHDMGEGLADGRPDFHASGRDWRTQPLWGLGLAETVLGGPAFFLHDARARSVTEAILWHGGEAEKSKEAFRNMPKKDRAALLKFLSSI